MTSALDLVIKMVLATQLRNVQTGEALLLEVVPKDTVFVALVYIIFRLFFFFFGNIISENSKND